MRVSKEAYHGATVAWKIRETVQSATDIRTCKTSTPSTSGTVVHIWNWCVGWWFQIWTTGTDVHFNVIHLNFQQIKVNNCKEKEGQDDSPFSHIVNDGIYRTRGLIITLVVISATAIMVTIIHIPQTVIHIVLIDPLSKPHLSGKD